MTRFVRVIQSACLAAVLALLTHGCDQGPGSLSPVFGHVSSQGSSLFTGTVVFVPARVEHRFHSISEDLTILVFFAPPES